MSHYELLFIVSQQYTEEEAEKINTQVKELIKAQGGEITLEDNLGKKKLAYQINHIGHGYYLLLEFDIENDKIKKLNDDLKLTNEVLRHLITVKKLKTVEQLKKEAKIKEKIEKKIEEETTAKEKEEKEEKEEKPKIKLEELDKKLDEILEGGEDII